MSTYIFGTAPAPSIDLALYRMGLGKTLQVIEHRIYPNLALTVGVDVVTLRLHQGELDRYETRIRAISVYSKLPIFQDTWTRT